MNLFTINFCALESRLPSIFYDHRGPLKFKMTTIWDHGSSANGQKYIVLIFLGNLPRGLQENVNFVQGCTRFETMGTSKWYSWQREYCIAFVQSPQKPEKRDIISIVPYSFPLCVSITLEVSLSPSFHVRSFVGSTVLSPWLPLHKRWGKFPFFLSPSFLQRGKEEKKTAFSEWETEIWLAMSGSSDIWYKEGGEELHVQRGGMQQKSHFSCRNGRKISSYCSDSPSPFNFEPVTVQETYKRERRREMSLCMHGYSSFSRKPPGERTSEVSRLWSTPLNIYTESIRCTPRFEKWNESIHVSMYSILIQGATREVLHIFLTNKIRKNMLTYSVHMLYIHSKNLCIYSLKKRNYP